MARYGLSAQSVLDLVQSIGSKPLGDVVEGQIRFPLVARLARIVSCQPDRHRRDAGRHAVGRADSAVSAGKRGDCRRPVDHHAGMGPAPDHHHRQRARPRPGQLRGRGTTANRRESVALPTGRYRIEYGGQFENLQRARTRLLIVVPLALVLILVLLYFTYHSLVDALRVFTGIPFAWVGGIFALWLRDMPFSISAGVGFIAMSGVAVLDDMILVSYIRQLRQRGLPLDEAVTQAAVTRLRPVLMTTLVASLGFLPMAFSDGMGAEVQRPLATVVIGGVIGAMVMSLLGAASALFAVQRVRLPRRSELGGDEPACGSEGIGLFSFLTTF